MVHIDKINISISAHAYNNSNNIKHFGRILDFKNGLNLVVGDNTSGKTTIARCLFYCLGMEELIDGKAGTGAMDKSVKDVFRYNDPDSGDHEWYVLSSYVMLQLSNSKKEVITIRRNIKCNELRDNILYVWKTSMTNDMKLETSREYYIHRENDHNVEFCNGFYALLSNFSELPLEIVTARNTDKGTLLYMQTLFALTYIEQTRGWSDFFANIRSFNIVNPKQRIIEYVMGYESNNTLITSDKLKERRKSLEEEWNTLTNDFISYLTYNEIFVVGLIPTLSKQKVALEELRYGIRNADCSMDDYIKQLQYSVSALESKQNAIKTAKDNNEYLEVLKKYQIHKEEYEKFCINLVMEIEKLNNIKKRVTEIEHEVKRYSSLIQVNNIVNDLDVKECPTCHQILPINNGHRFTILPEQIEESKNVLKMQKKFLSPMADKIERSVKNKELNKLYLEKQLSVELEQLKMLAELNDVNLNPLSIAEQFELVNNRAKIAALSSVKSHIETVIKKLNIIKDNYISICDEIKALKNQDAIENPINIQLNRFKEYLYKFNYTSNRLSQIFFKEDDTIYKYFPIVQHSENIEEDIRSDSSASDFIRCLWAYYITLLAIGPNHPGFLVMDEPCQHSMKEQSLKNLFEECAKLSDKQIILFCSSQPHTEELDLNKRKQDNPKNIIESLVMSLHDLEIHYQDIDPKAIIACV